MKVFQKINIQEEKDDEQVCRNADGKKFTGGICR